MSLSEIAQSLRDQIVDAYAISFNQFGEKHKTTQKMNELSQCFGTLRECLALAMPNESFYESRKTPVYNVGVTHLQDEKPQEFTSQQQLYIRTMCGSLSEFLEQVKPLLGNQAGRVFKKLNRRIKSVRKLVRDEKRIQIK